MRRLLYATVGTVAWCFAWSAIGAVAEAQSWDPFASETDETEIEADATGLLYSRFNADLAHDFAGEDRWEWRSKAFVEASVRKPRTWRAVVSGLGQHTLLDQNPENATFEPRLWEAYGVWETSAWELSVGQQVRRWGRGVPSVWDVLNPADLSELFFIEDEFAQQPIPMGRWTRYGQGYELELVLIPFYIPAKLPPNRSDWSPISIRDLEGLEEFAVVEQSLDQGVYPGLVTLPPHDFLHPEAGVRFSPSLSGMDLDLYFFSGYEDLAAPTFTDPFVEYINNQEDSPAEVLRDLDVGEIVTNNPIYYQVPERQWMIGGAFAMPLGSVTARLEVAATNRQSVYNERLERISVPVVEAAIGADYLTGDQFLWSLTLVNANFLTDEELYLIRPVNLLLSGVARYRVVEDRGWWIEMRGLWDITLGDSWLGPSVLYDVVDGVQLQAGVHLLQGAEPTPLSMFDHNDFAFFRVRYIF